MSISLLLASDVAGSNFAFSHITYFKTEGFCVLLFFFFGLHKQTCLCELLSLLCETTTHITVLSGTICNGN